MISFRRVRISKAFVEECVTGVKAGKSIALLGPRFGGKRYVHYKVLDCLKNEFGGLIVSFNVRTADDLPNLDAIRYNTVEGGKPGEGQGDPLEAITRVFQATGRRSILLAANIDRLPYRVSRMFLERVRAMVEDRKVAVILSGTMDFRDLVHGPLSEFNCTNQYVLQGYDIETFSEEIQQYCNVRQLNFEDQAEQLQRLWEFTGGNRHLARLLISVAAEQRTVTGSASADISRATIRIAMQTESIPGTYWSSLQHRPVELVSCDPECWQELEELVDQGRTRSRTGRAPGALELSGLAVREGRILRFASVFAEQLARSYFTAARIGDLYAQRGQWDEAFRRYKKMDSYAGARPVGREDRAAVEANVHSLGAAMFAAARNSADKVRSLFEAGARLLLGFEEISWWTYQDSWEQTGSESLVPVEFVAGLRSTLPTSESEIPPGLIKLPDSIERFAVAASMFYESPGQPTAVVLSSFASRDVLSRDRQAIARKLTGLFVEAHSHAVRAQLSTRRLEVRNLHVEILNRIFNFVGKPVFDVEGILKITGEQLRRLGYRRVLFCLVDPRRERIQGVVDTPGGYKVDLAAATDFALSTEEITDLQQWVFHNKKSRIVPNVHDEPLASPDCKSDGTIRAIAIVPIIDPAHSVLGTIHVERADDAVPSPQEVEDLDLFGKQLGRILVQSERMTLMQRSMDHATEPFMIANPLGEIVYANGEAATHFDRLTAGWQQPVALFGPESTLGRGIHQALRGEASVYQVDDFGEKDRYQGEVVSAALTDSRGKRIGCFVDVHDLRWLHNVIDALAKIGPAPTIDAAIEAFFNVVASFGYKGIRLYIEDPVTGKLRSKKARGLKGQGEIQFNSGAILLEDKHSHHVLLSGEPAIFCWSDGDIVYTKFGLKAMALPDPQLPVQIGKKPGDFWFEVPLYIGEVCYGKLAVDSDIDLKPEAFETMRLLVSQSRKLLAACREREVLAQEHDSAVREGLQTSMAAVAHNLGSRLSPLPNILGRYEDRESKYPELKEINAEFAALVEHSMMMIERIKDLLGQITLRYSTFDLSEPIQRALQSSQLRGAKFCAPTTPCSVEADDGLIESVLVELIQNSRVFAEAADLLRVSVRVKSVGNNRVAIEYWDNGPGVLPEYKTRIFEEFFTHRPGMKRSTGLGLAFVSKVLEAHGGSVLEDGQYGQGVHFVMELPVTKTV